MRSTKTTFVYVAACFWLVVGSDIRAEPVGTAFTYQGQFKHLGVPVTGPVDFEFSVWTAETGGLRLDVVGPRTLSLVNGLFTVMLDFGEDVFDGSAYWIDVSVRSPAGTGAYVALTPRQRIVPTPYALALPGLRTQQNEASPNLIGGWKDNNVMAGVTGATISGGGAYLSDPFPNRVTDDYGAVGGGVSNVAGDNNESTVDAAFATVSGGHSNQATAWGATVAGGHRGAASGQYSAVGGGTDNIASAEAATVGGGNANTASQGSAVVCGGTLNTASGQYATVAGGYNNKAVGQRSTVPGGADNSAGADYSFAAGRYAKVRTAAAAGDADGDEGTFVWSDNSGQDFESTGPNQFLIRAAGGVGIGTNSPANQLSVAGDANFTGKVGIGTDSPQYPLTVNGPVKVISHPSSYSMLVEGLTRFDHGMQIGTGSTSGVLSAKLRVSGGSIGLGHGSGVFSSNGEGTFIGAGFGTNNDNLDLLAGGLSRMRILTDGRIGIGTLTPSSDALLDVNGRVRCQSGGFMFPDGTIQTTATAGDGHSLDAADGSPADALYVSDLGNVGIGTTTPANRLTVHGSTYLKGNVQIETNPVVTALTVTGRVQLNDRLTAGEDILFNAGQGVYVLNGPGLKTTATNDLDLIAGSTSPQRVRVTAGGNVGVGVTTPQDKLEVNGGFVAVDSSEGGNITGLRIRENNDMRWTILYRTWQDDDLEILNETTGTVTMVFKADDKVGVGTTAPSHPFEVGTDSTNGNGAHVTAGGVWTNGSDRNSKADFQLVDKAAVLAKVVALPVTSWRYKGEDDRTRHIGPTAQDFYSSFGLGGDNRHIGTLDVDGVALAAIQGLHQLVREKEAEIEVLRTESAALLARLQALETTVTNLQANTGKVQE